MFVALKTDGDIRHRARDLAVRIGAVAAVLAVVFLVVDPARRPAPRVTAVVFVVAALVARRRPRSPRARPRGLGVRRHLRHDRARRRRPVPGAVPRRDAVDHRPGVLAHHHQRGGDGVHAEGDDVGRGGLHPDRARLPGVDLLGVPQADRGAPHPHAGPGADAARREAARPGGPPPPPSRARRRCRWSSRAGSSAGWPRWRRPSRWVRSWSRPSRRRPAAGRVPRGRSPVWCCCAPRRRTSASGRRPVRRARSPGRCAQRLLDAARRSDDLSPARLVVLATRGVAGVEPYVTRYLPALVPAVVLPLVTLAAITWLDPLSGLVVALTLPLVPVFAVLVGLTTRDRARTQWRALEALSGHFLDVVRGLPTLVAHRRAEAQVGTIRSVTHRYRRATVDTLKVAFASSSVLELVATLSVALVAVTVGLRLASGTRRLPGRPHRPAARARGLLAAAPRRRGVPRGRRGHRRPRRRRRPAGAGRPGRDRHGAAHRDRARAARPRDRLLPRRSPDPSARPRAARPRAWSRSPGRPAAASRRSWRRCAASWRPWPATSGRRHPARRPRPGAGGAAWSAWAPQRPWLLADTVGANVRIGRPVGRRRRGVGGAAQRRPRRRRTRPPPRPGHAARRGRRRPVRRPAGPRRAGPRRARRPPGRAPRRAERPPRRGDRAGPPRDPRPARRSAAWWSSWPTGRPCSPPPTGWSSWCRAGRHGGGPRHPTGRCGRRTPPPSAGGPCGRPGRGRRAPAAVGHADGHPARRPVHRVRRRPHGDRRLAHHPRQRAAAGALPDGGDRRGPPLRARPPGAAPRRARAQPRRRPARARRAPGAGLRRPRPAGPRSPRPAPRRPAHRCRRRRRRPARRPAAGAPAARHRGARRRGRRRCSPPSSPRRRARSCCWSPARGRSRSCSPAAAPPPPSRSSSRTARCSGPGSRRSRTGCASSSSGARRTGPSTPSARRRPRSPGPYAAPRAPSPPGTALTSAAAGLGVVAVAALVDPAATSPALLALLLLVPLALADADRRAGRRRRPVGARTCGPRAPRPARRHRARRSPTPPLPCPCPTATASRCTVPSWGGPTVRRWRSTTSSCVRASTSGSPGPPGPGKSTLAATLVRFIDPVSGEVLLDGTDLRRLALDDVRRRVGLVDDDPHVFASTVAENVRLARPDADDDEVRAALDRACLGAWVDGLPDGIHTHVGAGRREVSGGERARLALARSLLADPPVLVLDEPTAHLDGPDRAGRRRARCSTRRPGSDARSCGSPTARSGWTRWTGWCTSRRGRTPRSVGLLSRRAQREREA